MPIFSSGHHHPLLALGVESGHTAGCRRLQLGNAMTDPILSAVQNHPFTQGLTPEHCATLASLGRRTSFATGDLIFQEGDERHEFFLLLSGRVSLELMAQGKPLRVHTLEGGDELGWSAVIVGRGKHFQARALEPVEARASAQYKRIPPRMKIPVSTFLRYDDARAAQVSRELSATLELYNPDSARTVRINNNDVPIEYEITSALADTLEGSPVWDFEIAGFRSSDFSLVTQQGLSDGLVMFGPHRFGHIPVVLVHGTASSPARWAEMVNEVGNDPTLRDRYELWFFIYNTGNPIAYSAMLLRDALSNAVAELDPEGKDPGLKQILMIGHSQGGLLTKMTVIDSGMGLWPFSVPPEDLQASSETKELLTHGLIFKPLPFVKRVVFIATPHRGSYQALGFLGSLASWLVNLPGRLTKLSVDFLTLQKQGVFRGSVTGIPTAIDNMNPNNIFIKNLASIPIADGVVAHSIIAVDSDAPLSEAGDGVVKYMSAHIDGVESEKIVRSSHSVQGNPETILEVKRILHEHAEGLPAFVNKTAQPTEAHAGGREEVDRGAGQQ
jgi:hypothetical protein